MEQQNKPIREGCYYGELEDSLVTCPNFPFEGVVRKGVIPKTVRDYPGRSQYTFTSPDGLLVIYGGPGMIQDAIPQLELFVDRHQRFYPDKIKRKQKTSQ